MKIKFCHYSKLNILDLAYVPATKIHRPSANEKPTKTNVAATTTTTTPLKGAPLIVKICARECIS